MLKVSDGANLEELKSVIETRKIECEFHPDKLKSIKIIEDSFGTIQSSLKENPELSIISRSKKEEFINIVNQNFRQKIIN